jgi:hypothetical protein
MRTHHSWQHTPVMLLWLTDSRAGAKLRRWRRPSGIGTTVRLDRSATLLCASTLGRIGLLDSGGAIPVLMYHSVSNGDERGVRPYYRLSTSPARFREQIRLLAAAVTP